MKVSRNRWLALTIVLIIAADWIIKAVVQARIPQYARQPVVDGWLTLTHTLNFGVSWGFLGDFDNALRFPLVVLLTLVGIGATVSIVRSSRDRWIHIAGSLVLGGAIGNLGDRLLNGGVTDYIFVHFFPFIFNFADIAITIGGVILAARMLLDRSPDDASSPTHA